MRRILYTTALAAAAGLALSLSAAAANAAPAFHPDATHVQGDGTAGIEALHSVSVKNMGATLVTQPAFQNIGQVGKGGGGIQGCDPNTRQAVQIGETATGPTTDTVVYDIGTLPATAGLSCENAGVLPAPVTLNANLAGVSQGDTVMVFWAFRNVRVWVPGHKSGKRWIHGYHKWQGHAEFQAYDATTGTGPFTAWVRSAPIWNLDSDGFGVQQDTTLVTSCTPLVNEGAYMSGACNKALVGTNIFTDSAISGVLGTGPGLTVTGQWNDVYSSVGGLGANPAVAATNDSLSPATQSFSPSTVTIYTGNPVG